MSDFTIEDLRLPCKHGERIRHRYPDGPFTPKQSWPHIVSCSGGRVPTRTELIDLLDLDYEASLIEHIRQQKLGHVNWSEVVDAALGDSE